jgi:hypothetical protein
VAVASRVRGTCQELPPTIAIVPRGDSPNDPHTRFVADAIIRSAVTRMAKAIARSALRGWAPGRLAIAARAANQVFVPAARAKIGHVFLQLIHSGRPG